MRVQGTHCSNKMRVARLTLGRAEDDAEATTVALILSLVLGLGVLLVFLSATRPPASPRAPRGARLSVWLEDLLRQAGVDGGRPRDVLLASLVAGGAVGAAAQALLGWPACSLAAFGVGSVLPVWYLQNRRQARRAALQDALADAVDALRASVRTGMSVEEGLLALARTGPAPLRPALRELARDLRLAGFDEALLRAQARLADPLFDTVAAALLMAHRVGGHHLGSVLDSLGQAVRGAARAEREVRAQQARTVLSARIIAALPLGLVAIVRGLSPHYLDPFATPTGQLLLALCVLSVAVGYAAMRRATRLPTMERSRT